jgi:vacuolar-type H+-ATPase subunit I/STV1
MPTAGMNEEASHTPEGGMQPEGTPPVEGRRTQLKIVRENLQSLSSDVVEFRRSHEASVRKLEKQVTALKNELRAQTVSKDVGSFRKSHEASTKRLEKQIANLRKDLAALKSGMAKDAAKARAKQDAALSKFLAKVGGKKPSKAAKKSKKR